MVNSRKKKVGKQRRDKFYHLAKETGFRSRAAFKLLQLNRKFEFLQKSRVIIDLCAAPGGWMQVAQQNMPVSSLVIGVDLAPIKAIPNCIAIQEDITTPRCLQLLKQELKNWKADVVLNDGAPNVGKNWVHDAYQQACLTLSALKVATQVLRPGGWFITKIFRSKDYNSLLWVFQQMFKKVHSTKPSASRMESAEIFVVCQGYLAPHKLDERFLDARHVFQDVEDEKEKVTLATLVSTKKKKALGYDNEAAFVYSKCPVSEFIVRDDYIEILQKTNELVLDHPLFEKSLKTTDEIREFCKDIQVLNLKDLQQLIKWRKAMSELWTKLKKTEKEEEEGTEEKTPAVTSGADHDDDDETDDELEKVEKEIENLKGEERQELKRKRKKVLKARRKLQEKLNLEMVHPGDSGPQEDYNGLFSLEKMSKVALTDMTTDPQMPQDDEDEEDDIPEPKKKFVKYERGEKTHLHENMSDEENSDDAEEVSDDENPTEGLGFKNMPSGVEEISDLDSMSEADSEEEEELKNPLLVDLMGETALDKKKRTSEMWFSKDIFKNINEDDDEEFEIEKMKRDYAKSKESKVKEKLNKIDKLEKNAAENVKADNVQQSAKTKKKRKHDSEDEDFEVVPAEQPSKKNLKLDVEGLALGTLLIKSSKMRRDIEDAAWNRYADNDENLPSWFLEDEKKVMRTELPLTKELVQEYKQYTKEIDARPIKKVIEAKARKKRKSMKRMDKARKKAESIMENDDLPNREKANQIRQLYKKAQKTKKRNVTYVVATKHTSAKRMRKAPGTKGPVRIVDPRMKKDMRRQKQADRGRGKKGGKKGGKGPAPRGKGGRGGKQQQKGKR